jgi:hypothetical protein
MKTLKTIFAALALVVICSVAKASDDSDIARLSKDNAITSYINAMTNGNMKGFNEVLDPTAKFSMLRGKDVISFTKADMLDFMNSNKDIKQACTTTASVVESTGDVSVVKVDMKFKDFTRTNYVTIANTGKGWKITSVYSLFK